MPLTQGRGNAPFELLVQRPGAILRSIQRFDERREGDLRSWRRATQQLSALCLCDLQRLAEALFDVIGLRKRV
jgi:hypothetical protein